MLDHGSDHVQAIEPVRQRSRRPEIDHLAWRELAEDPGDGDRSVDLSDTSDEYRKLAHVKVRGLLLKSNHEQGPVVGDGSMEPHTDNVARGQEESVTDRDAAVVRGVRLWRTIGVVALLLVLVAAAAIVGGVIGRATASGPSLVVMPGPVVQESPAAESIPANGVSDSGTLVVADKATRPPAVFTASTTLSDELATASGYRLSRTGLDGETVAQGLAEVFGASGVPTRANGGWTVGTDGTSPTLTVRDDAAMSWTFTDPVATAAAADGVSVSQGRAKETATAILEGIGVDVKSIDWQVSRYDDRVAVTATQLLGGDRTSMSWQVNFGQADAVVSASGFAAEFIEVPGYDIIGAATDVRRAALPTWSAIGPTPVVDSTPTASTPRPTTPAAVGPSGRPALQVDVASIVIVDATLGLGQFWQPDGTLLVLPAYRLTGSDGSLWTLIAVSGDYVKFVKAASVASATIP
jgi:hypothetical protein